MTDKLRALAIQIAMDYRDGVIDHHGMIAQMNAITPTPPAAEVDMVPRAEMVDALTEQRRYFSKENDAELARINLMRNNLWTLFNAACDVSAFDWSSEGLDEDADAAMVRLQTAVESIKKGAALRPFTEEGKS